MRYFRHVGGFADKRLAAIRVETIDGHAVSHEVYADGTDKSVGHVGVGNVWIPSWNEQELVNMVEGKRFEEVWPDGKGGFATAPPAPVLREKATGRVIKAPPNSIEGKPVDGTLGEPAPVESAKT